MTSRNGSPMIPRDRLPYSAIVDRPQRKLPGGARVVVWVIVNVEDWDISRAMPRQVIPVPTGVAVLPDIGNWGWHEYGMRVGFWRMKQALDSRGHTGIAVDQRTRLRELSARGQGRPGCQVGLPGAQLHPDAAAPGVGPARRHSPDGRDHRALHRLASPRDGWARVSGETMATVDYLAEAGIRYICDWPVDDQPCDFATAHGTMVAMPYPMEMNDVVTIAVQHQSPEEFLRRMRDTFDRLYEEGAEQPRVMAIAIHPYLSGAPTGSSTSNRDSTTFAGTRMCCSGRASSSSTGTWDRERPPWANGFRRPCWPGDRALSFSSLAHGRQAFSLPLVSMLSSNRSNQLSNREELGRPTTVSGGGGRKRRDCARSRRVR